MISLIGLIVFWKQEINIWGLSLGSFGCFLSAVFFIFYFGVVCLCLGCGARLVSVLSCSLCLVVLSCSLYLCLGLGCVWAGFLCSLGWGIFFVSPLLAFFACVVFSCVSLLVVSPGHFWDVWVLLESLFLLFGCVSYSSFADCHAVSHELDFEFLAILLCHSLQIFKLVTPAPASMRLRFELDW